MFYSADKYENLRWGHIFSDSSERAALKKQGGEAGYMGIL